jgi:hypothetical protein
MEKLGEKKSVSFPAEEKLRTTMEKKRSAKFPICRSEGGNFVDQQKIGKLKKVRPLSRKGKRTD